MKILNSKFVAVALIFSMILSSSYSALAMDHDAMRADSSHFRPGSIIAFTTAFSVFGSLLSSVAINLLKQGSEQNHRSQNEHDIDHSDFPYNGSAYAGTAPITNNSTNSTSFHGETKKELNENGTRTPKAVLVDLLRFFREADGKFKAEEYFSTLYPWNQCSPFQGFIESIKLKMLSHDLTLEKTQAFLSGLQKFSYLCDDLSNTVTNLKYQMMTKVDGPILWEDFWGRIFDSIFAAELIGQNHREVADATYQVGLGVAELIEREIARLPHLEGPLDKKIHYLLSKKDPRFWFPKVPALADIVETGPDGATSKIIDYLNKPIANGFDTIARPYLIVKVGLLLRAIKRNPKYLSIADDLYVSLNQMIKGIRVVLGRKHLDQVAGITLPGQPPVISETWMEPSSRPTTQRYPKLAPREPMTSNFNARKALENQLAHGVTWCSGMSGSTNINLSAWYWLAKNSNEIFRKDIDQFAFLLGVMSFLIYDGGHSIFEVLWAANSINSKLNLGFDLADSENIEEFIPDFNRFAQNFDEELSELIQSAFEKSFDAMVQISYQTKGKDPRSSFVPKF